MSPQGRLAAGVGAERYRVDTSIHRHRHTFRFILMPVSSGVINSVSNIEQHEENNITRILFAYLNTRME